MAKTLAQNILAETNSEESHGLCCRRLIFLGRQAGCWWSTLCLKISKKVSLCQVAILPTDVAAFAAQTNTQVHDARRDSPNAPGAHAPVEHSIGCGTINCVGDGILRVAVKVVVENRGIDGIVERRD